MTERWIIQAKNKNASSVLSLKWRKVTTQGNLEYSSLEEAIKELSYAWNHAQWHFQLFNIDTHEVIPYEILCR